MRGAAIRMREGAAIRMREGAAIRMREGAAHRDRAPRPRTAMPSSAAAHTIKGESDYASQQQKIANEYDHIGEVVREVGVSNPYDAMAAHIDLYPLYMLDASCLVVVDDGVGMDNVELTREQRRGCNGSARSSLDSYFHIGNSTKPRGSDIGQFCMGSNLALAQADVLFALATRTEHMAPGMYWVVVQPRMNVALRDLSKSIRSELLTRDDALDAVLTQLDHHMVGAWSARLTRAFDTLHDVHGTLQLFVSSGTDLHKKRLLDVTKEGWTSPKKRSVCHMVSAPLHATQLYTYIRFMTRHGSLLHVPEKRCKLRQRAQYAGSYEKDTREAVLRIVTDAYPEGLEVPYGFPYIPQVDRDSEVREIKAGARLESLTSFVARLGPVEFTRAGPTGPTPVAIFCIMDSFNSKLEQYEGLDRTGHQRSGLTLKSVQGIVISCRGIFVTSFRGDALARILDSLVTQDENPNSSLEKVTKMALTTWNQKNSLQNLMIVVDGHFDLKTDRNGITPAETQRLCEKDFLLNLGCAIQQFRDGTSLDSRRFNEMLNHMDRTCKGDAEKDIQKYSEKRARESLDAGTIRLVPRARLAPRLLSLLEVTKEAYAIPRHGHENALVHLFGLYGSTFRAIGRLLEEDPRLVPPDMDMIRFRRLLSHWKRIGLVFAHGVDVQAFDWDASNDAACLSAKGRTDALHRMCHIEVKIKLETEFNHPFKAVDCIVVSEVKESLVTVRDITNNNEAQVYRPQPSDPLYGIGYWLKDIKRCTMPVKSRINVNEDLVIPVIVFSKLLQETAAPFATVEMMEPCPDAAKKKQSEKRKR